MEQMNDNHEQETNLLMSEFTQIVASAIETKEENKENVVFVLNKIIETAQDLIYMIEK